MLIHYAVSNLLNNEEKIEVLVQNPANFLAGGNEPEWINLGGQLVTTTDIDTLRKDICNCTLESWEAIHGRYNELWHRYPTDKLRHALHALCQVLGSDVITGELWAQTLADAERIQQRICEQVFLSRKKDHDNPFRSSTCRNDEEALAIFGKAEENRFVNNVRKETAENIKKIERLRDILTTKE